MPLGQSQCIPQAVPGGRVTPGFDIVYRFRQFIDGSLALASLNRACWDHVPTFPQRSPPSLLTTAACGGLRSAPDCRTRRALLHLSYSCAAPFGPAILVTQDPTAVIGTLTRPVDASDAAFRPGGAAAEDLADADEATVGGDHHCQRPHAEPDRDASWRKSMP